jgi:hypothetical protein
VQLVQRRRVVLVARVLDLDVAKAGEQPAIARVPGRHHAVEHVDAVGHAGHQVFRRADAHQVVRLVLRQARADVLEHAHHVFLRLAHRQAADGEAREVDVFQAASDSSRRCSYMPPWTMPNSAFGFSPPLNSFIERWAQRSDMRIDLAASSAGGRAAVDLVGRAFVELHHDVRVQRALDLHRDFRRQEQLAAVDRRGELDALFRDLAHRAQRKHLEAAGVGQDRLVPAHEAVQAAELVQHFGARAQPQVEGVAEDDLRADFLQFDRRPSP